MDEKKRTLAERPLDLSVEAFRIRTGREVEGAPSREDVQSYLAWVDEEWARQRGALTRVDKVEWERIGEDLRDRSYYEDHRYPSSIGHCQLTPVCSGFPEDYDVWIDHLGKDGETDSYSGYVRLRWGKLQAFVDVGPGRTGMGGARTYLRELESWEGHGRFANQKRQRELLTEACESMERWCQEYGQERYGDRVKRAKPEAEGAKGGDRSREGWQASLATVSTYGGTETWEPWAKIERKDDGIWSLRWTARWAPKQAVRDDASLKEVMEGALGKIEDRDKRPDHQSYPEVIVGIQATGGERGETPEQWWEKSKWRTRMKREEDGSWKREKEGIEAWIEKVEEWMRSADPKAG